MLNYPRRPGVAPSAWRAYLNASEQAAIDLKEHHKLRVTQAIGNAPASAGFHARDGYVSAGPGLDRVPYCASTDLSVLWLSIAEIRAWLDALAWWGFAAWYRPWTSNGKPNYHIHCVYAGLPMKPELDRQVADFLVGKTGLVGHDVERFYTPNLTQRQYVRALHDWSNKRGPKPPPPPKAPAPAMPQLLETLNPYIVRLPDGKTFRAAAIDGTAWIPVRPWFEALGLGKMLLGDGTEIQSVKWHPEERAIYFQGKKIEAPVRVLRVDGEMQGCAPIRKMVSERGLGLIVSGRNITIYRPKTYGGLAPRGGSK